jgi:hypothetical protein
MISEFVSRYLSKLVVCSTALRDLCVIIGRTQPSGNLTLVPPSTEGTRQDLRMAPIGALIATRTAELGIRRSELAARMDYKNLPKGIRQIDRLMQGDFSRLTDHLRSLPAALDLEGRHRNGFRGNEGEGGRS